MDNLSINLTITDTCNLKCQYCYQSHTAHKSKNSMTLDTAKKTLLYLFNRSFEKYNSIEIIFFGGEPFVNKELIINLVEWTGLEEFNIPYTFFASTNGTLIKGNLKKWLKRNKEKITLGLSLDGTRTTHNTNRDNSYDKINIDFFLKTYPNQAVRMTISSETISNLYNDITHLHKLGFLVDAAYDYYFISSKENLKILSSQLKKLCDYYIKNPNIIPCSILNTLIPDLAEEKNIVGRTCMSGINMISIDTIGNEYPCQAFQPNAMKENEGIKIEASIIKLLDITNTLKDDSCGSCVIEPMCPTCYGDNLLRDSDISTRNKSMCDLQKITALAISYLYGEKIKKKQLDLDSSTEASIIRSIILIQSSFNKINET